MTSIVINSHGYILTHFVGLVVCFSGPEAPSPKGRICHEWVEGDALAEELTWCHSSARRHCSLPPHPLHPNHGDGAYREVLPASPVATLKASAESSAWVVSYLRGSQRGPSGITLRPPDSLSHQEEAALGGPDSDKPPGQKYWGWLLVVWASCCVWKIFVRFISD